MTGIAWFVQFVHYPMFDEVGKKQFRFFMREHLMQMMYVVAPVMVIETLVAIWLAIGTPSFQATFSLLALIGIWIATFMLHLPDYRQLAVEKDKKVIKRLIRNNWIRTGLWTLRSALLFSLLWFLPQ